MKATVLIIFMAVFTACSSKKVISEKMPVTEQTENIAAPVDFHEASTWLLGYFSRNMLTRPPHSEWFLRGYDEYKINEEPFKRLMEISKENLSVSVVMGSWCPDSRREVPRFLKILDSWNFPAGNLTYIGVDDSKISPVADYDKLDIQRVPTFIFYKNNVEAGRIIENPVTSLEQDMVNILTGNEKQ